MELSDSNPTGSLAKRFLQPSKPGCDYGGTRKNLEKRSAFCLLPSAHCLLLTAYFSTSSRRTGGTLRSSAAFSSASESFRKVPAPVSTLARYFNFSLLRWGG